MKKGIGSLRLLVTLCLVTSCGCSHNVFGIAKKSKDEEEKFKAHCDNQYAHDSDMSQTAQQSCRLYLYNLSLSFFSAY